MACDGSGSLSGVRLRRAVLLYGIDDQRRIPWTFHSRNTTRHSLYAQADNILRMLGEQPLDYVAGDVAFKHVAIDLDDVTALEPRRHPRLAAHVKELSVGIASLARLTVGARKVHAAQTVA